ncbi:MAG TPA: squalene synthase HpnC [Burkholderiales bacterium]|jgi:squalene synthase HpnC|nr:squalene synthase HpnC [Burkholderiales bacterium]
MAVNHYENFPVASVLLPERLRRPVELIYSFARQADDFADEGDAPPEQRLHRLAEFSRELDRIERGESPRLPLFADLAQVITAHRLPVGLFRDLISAFSQDVTKNRYADFGEVMDYCRRSANPVGRLLLHLYQATEVRNLACSDAICSSLQLINFLQDVEIDFRKNRVYLPQDEMAEYGVTEALIADRANGTAWQALMMFQIERARSMLLAGAPLARQLPGRIGLELRLIVMGGSRTLEKLQASRGDVFRQRPVLQPFDWITMLFRSLFAYP